MALKNGLLWVQKPALSGSALLNMVGPCTFEPDEYRAAKHSYYAERFVWVSRLNNLRIAIKGEVMPLRGEAYRVAIELPYQRASLSYKQLKDELIKRGLVDDSIRFVGVTGKKEGGKDAEDQKLIELRGWNEIRKALKNLDYQWSVISQNPDLFDRITTILHVYKTDEETAQELGKTLAPLGWDRTRVTSAIDALQTVSFKEFINISTKALKIILPYMEEGQRYDEACVSAGYHHSSLRNSNEKSLYLPPYDADMPRNPVVARALGQARKVVNAIIREHGSPRRVHIEMARDLSHPLQERYDIEKEQKEYAARNEKLRDDFTEQFGYRPQSREFEKWLLYKEQDCKCAYSLKPLDLERLIADRSYAEVDHALPYSRSYDDSKNNKVLVLTEENRNKGNRTPYEYLDGANESLAWQKFEAFVGSNHKYRQAKRDRLLRKHFSADDAAGFKERNLNDTRYISKYFKNFIEENLLLSDTSAQRCVVLSGSLTSFLRARWGLTKVREQSDRHHALDATVVAACSHSLVKRLADYSRSRELRQVPGGFIDGETGDSVDLRLDSRMALRFPDPWEHFREDLENRLSDTPGEGIRPLFVSRAPKRLNGGPAHKDTIYSRPRRLEKTGGVTQKVSLTSLKLKDIDLLVDQERNKPLYDTIRERLNEYGDNPQKAFAPDKPLYKPLKDGSPGPIVRSVTLEIGKMSGIPVRGGIAKNDTMLRVDVFNKDGKFHLVPVYVHHRVAKELPNQAIVQGKEEEDWTTIDNTFTFVFSLYPNDLVKITQRGKPPITGYYAGVDRATSNVNLWAHDRDAKIGKDGLIRSIGIKTALSLEKFHVDVLGRIYKAKPEERRGLA